MHVSCVCHTQDINATYILVCNTFAVLASRKPNAGASELMMQIVHWLSALHADHFPESKKRKNVFDGWRATQDNVRIA
jgi:hypothetical protein